METLSLGFIGAGRMASAMVDVLLGRELIPAGNIIMYDPDETRLAALAKRGVQAAKSNRAIVETCALTVLAVKPQVMETVLADIADISAGRSFISIAAGFSTQYILMRLAPTARVVRVMPNTPLSVGCGSTVIARSEGAPAELLQLAELLFSSMGAVAFLPEDKLNEVIGVTSTSPAFFFRMAGVMAAAAAEQGIGPETAMPLIAKTMEGSARMLMQGIAPEALVEQVASPGGTTRAALSVLDGEGFDEILRRAMLRCTERAYELCE